MEAGVETSMESQQPPSLELRLLGPLAVRRGGVALALPASRKVRALLAYLALAPRPVTRSHLCDLLWDVPNDPRGELRWCLSKLRGLLDDGARRRVLALDDSIALDLAGCRVDALEVARAADAGVDALNPQRQRALLALCEGDFVEGLDLARSPGWSAWLTAQRRRLRDGHVALLEHAASALSDADALPLLEQWTRVAPFERRAHERLLGALARLGRRREGDEHVAATAARYDAEGLDSVPLRRWWHDAARAPDAASMVAAASVPSAPSAEPAQRPPPEAARRASIAVMPFTDRSAAPGTRGGAADALAHDVITRLAKLRSLLVIAQGSVFALHERGIGGDEAARLLGVDYVVGGTVRIDGGRIAVGVELSETRSGRVAWAESYRQPLDDAFDVLEQIGNRIVASVAGEVELIERNRAILQPPASLDAWQAHHRGLWHMVRFSRPDNEQARHWFQTAVALDPTFARAWAGLSFTHFQTAFQGWDGGGRDAAVERALDAAGQSLMADDRDPAAHWAMGRALWLRGGDGAAIVGELERAIELSPNFALGHYTLAFVQSQSGDAQAAIAASDHSRELSPFDPMLFAMLGSRAMALVRLGRHAEAADWAVQAAARPNAHPHIHAIAAYSLALAGRGDEARSHAAAVRRTLPDYGVADFLRAFRFDERGAALFRDGAREVGMA